ncbi:MAG: hypothetical protein ACK5PF_07525 [bacterium]
MFEKLDTLHARRKGDYVQHHGVISNFVHTITYSSTKFEWIKDNKIACRIKGDHETADKKAKVRGISKKIC